MKSEFTPIYVGIFLSKESRRQLINAVEIRHVNLYAEHVTLAFGRHMRPEYPLGLKVQLHISFLLEDERGQALVLHKEGLGDLLAEEQIPHITVSTAEDVKPFYSNELIKKGRTQLLTKQLRGPAPLLEGVLDYFPRTYTAYPHLPIPREA